jgi:signal transduction histidine kinase
MGFASLVLALFADPGHLDQILVNLTINARDVMPDGGALRIRTAGADDRVLTQVADTSIGIDAEVRDRIFEAFFTTKSRQYRTGLGLYVVYTLVQEMGGTIEVESSEGAGIRLPSRSRPHATAQPPPP